MMATDYTKEVEQRLIELAQETDKVKKSDFFKEYLEVMAKFWDYSYQNQLLIFFQRKGASRVAGFVAWKELGRFVKKGEKAIKILAPFKTTIPMVDEKSGEEKPQEMIRFHPVSVFDVSQTHGKELPALEMEVSGDDGKGLLKSLKAFCKSRRIKLEFKKLGVNGLYGYSQGGKVVIDKSQGINSQVATLIHEIAHELIHKGEERRTLTRKVKEIQAEGTAYVVLRSLGMETRSFNYLALYDADHKAIMENLEVIAGTSREILGAFHKEEKT